MGRKNLEKLSVKKLKDIIKTERPIFVEAGANVGRDSQRFLDAFTNISLYCFEPDPRCIRKFKKRINDPRCTMYEAAVWNKNSMREMFLSSGSRLGHSSVHINSSSLHRPKQHLKKHPSIHFDEKVIVKTMRLDTWFQQSNISEIDLLWADVQGAEKEMIEGGLKTFAATRYFYTEFSDEELYEGQINLKQILALLPGFKVKKVYSGDVLLQNAAVARRRET